MSKFTPLWDYIKSLDKDCVYLTFSVIEKVAGLPIDHSFLTYKKELNELDTESERYL